MALATDGRSGNRLILLCAVKLSKAGDISRLSTPPILHFLEQPGFVLAEEEKDCGFMTSPHAIKQGLGL
ncbi:MAG: hypothetical protein IPL99_04595 [Candidatus Competibacteraceae bacterium]|nr:hypothetical protein [Candidatus Competibacteraceae bacterium]